MKRREFMAAGAALVCTGLAARAQQGRVPTIGVLVLGNPPPESFLQALRGGLQSFGYIEGVNIRFEIRSAEGRHERLAALASELIARQVDLLVAYQTPPAIAAKKATSDIPVVFSAVGDPLATGLAASFARPGGNATGTTAGTTETAGKTVEFVRELLPSARRLAVLANEIDPFTRSYLDALGQGAQNVDLELLPMMVRPSAPLEAAFSAMTDKQADAVVVQASVLSEGAAKLAIKHRLPSVASPTLFTRIGGLMSYSVDLQALMIETAAYIDKIFKGARPADLPVGFPTRFQLMVNLKTAKAIGVEIPQTLLTRADEVIE
jgi:putative ABC transport system substrate-binding protein